jgi:2,4-dienoyl-CoA reductase-like NADH-dependent reductase (Old Yellow Enzyme family)
VKANPVKNSKLFEPITLAPGLVLRNRVAMAPMTTWASNDDGTVSDEETAYYRRRALDVGLVVTGCTHVQANGVGFAGECGRQRNRQPNCHAAENQFRRHLACSHGSRSPAGVDRHGA